MDALVKEFELAVQDVCRRSRSECQYNPGFFIQMIGRDGAVGAVRKLIASPSISDGFTTLYEKKRLDLTVEALVSDERFRPLFSDQEVSVARQRLTDLGYQLPNSTKQMAQKGSQAHLQALVNNQPKWLNSLLFSASPSLRQYAQRSPEWVSPLRATGYKEYRDGALLDKVGVAGKSALLAEFWPDRGPVWDGLATVRGRDGSNGVILLEAKSHAPELIGPGSKAEGRSLDLIDQSLAGVKRALDIPAEADWTGSYYQAANRVAHLYFMNVIAQVPTWLVFLAFTGDAEQRGPEDVCGWREALDKQKATLRLPDVHMLSGRIITAFAPV